MNYKYIEDLLERYFQCQTTDAEEQILHNFFLSEDVPAEFAPYADLFGAFRAEAGTTLPADFDSRLSQRLKSEQSNRRPLRARIAAINRSLRPFYKAAASVALVITVGTAASQYWSSRAPEPVEYNYSNYHDTYSDPEMARETLTDALKDLSDALRGSDATLADTIEARTTATED
ncbi:MAG: hypothetical protein IKH47_03920 [Bacteroidaceae bacterium]|nr:hypothetical protein [Bacteroidaceae bacterium]MBR6713862.1 hypothetical protein [Bacteroidaceae bacterium]